MRTLSSFWSTIKIKPDSSITNEPRVIFTKASCTLDASVKSFYSYRVDDVHLTSYKVLANRSEAGAN